MFVKFKAPQDYSISHVIRPKQIHTVFQNVLEPLHLHITGDSGGAGVGKSNLVKILTSFSKKNFYFIFRNAR